MLDADGFPVGIYSEMPLRYFDSIETVGTGFGNMMAGFGLPIGFGVILGQLMSDTEAARVIAKTIVNAVPHRFVLYAIAGAGFILAILVFFDVTSATTCFYHDILEEKLKPLSTKERKNPLGYQRAWTAPSLT